MLENEMVAVNYFLEALENDIRAELDAYALADFLSQSEKVMPFVNGYDDDELAYLARVISYLVAAVSQLDLDYNYFRNNGEKKLEISVGSVNMFLMYVKSTAHHYRDVHTPTPYLD